MNIAQSIAETATAAAINIGAKDAAEKTSRAQTVAQIAAYFTAAGKGDLVSALQQVPAAIAKITDPGLNKLATDLWSAGAPFLGAESAVIDALGGMDGIFGAIGAGMASIAGAYLTAPATAK